MRVVAALILAGCSFGQAPTATPLPTDFVAIDLHCGLEFVVIDWDDRLWRFDIGEDAEVGIPPGWREAAVVQIVPAGDGANAVGPDGIVRSLVEVEIVEDATPSEICI